MDEESTSGSPAKLLRPEKASKTSTPHQTENSLRVPLVRYMRLTESDMVSWYFVLCYNTFFLDR
jgi:hypothetical protein